MVQLSAVCGAARKLAVAHRRHNGGEEEQSNEPRHLSCTGEQDAVSGAGWKIFGRAQASIKDHGLPDSSVEGTKPKLDLPFFLKVQGYTISHPKWLGMSSIGSRGAPAWM